MNDDLNDLLRMVLPVIAVLIVVMALTTAVAALGSVPVSYTHLTLPTILRV